MIKLVGRMLSPFSRRVAISAKMLGIGFEHINLSMMTDSDEIRRFNPMTRVPTVVLEDGTTLTDSSVILDWLDQQVEEGRRLVPASGTARRDVLQLAFLASGAGDKTVVTYYELSRRPDDKVHMPAVEGNLGQINAAFGMLEKAAAGGGWMVGGRMSQADISAVVFLEFAGIVLGERFDKGGYPALGDLCARAYDSHPAFAETDPK